MVFLLILIHQKSILDSSPQPVLYGFCWICPHLELTGVILFKPIRSRTINILSNICRHSWEQLPFFPVTLSSDFNFAEFLFLWLLYLLHSLMSLCSSQARPYWCASLPSSGVMLVACKWPQQKYLHRGNWEIPPIRLLFPRKFIVKHLPAHPCPDPSMQHCTVKDRGRFGATGSGVASPTAGSHNQIRNGILTLLMHKIAQTIPVSIIIASFISYSGARPSQGWLQKRSGVIPLAFCAFYPQFTQLQGASLMVYWIPQPVSGVPGTVWDSGVQPVSQSPWWHIFQICLGITACGIEIQTKLRVTELIFHRNSKY